MRPTNRLINRAAVLAAAGLVALSITGRSAHADTVLYSTGFETPTFTTTGGSGGGGNLNGQGSFVESLTGTGTGVVETSNVISGAQSVDITRNSASTLDFAPHTVVSQASPFTVTAQVDVKIPTFSGTGGNGPNFGLDLYGNNGALEIGSLSIDASNGNIWDTANGRSAALITDGANPSEGPAVPGGPVGGDPTPISANTVETLKIVANFASGAGGPVTLQYFIGTGPNGATTLEDTETTTVNVSSFDFAYLFGGAALGAPTGDNGTNSGIFDNYSVSTNAAVPEPTSLAVVGVAGMLLSLRRSRRAVSGN
jgi:hypothetical protein